VPVEERNVQPLVFLVFLEAGKPLVFLAFLEARKCLPAHQGLFRLKVPLGVTANKGDCLFDAVLVAVFADEVLGGLDAPRPAAQHQGIAEKRRIVSYLRSDRT